MSTESEAGTKICPECAEQVRAVARVCRYCGYRGAPPPAEEEDSAEAEADAPTAEQDAVPGEPETERASEVGGSDCFCGCGRQVDLSGRTANDWGVIVAAELADWGSGEDLIGQPDARDFVRVGSEIYGQLQRSVHGERVEPTYQQREMARWVIASRRALAGDPAAGAGGSIEVAPEPATASPPRTDRRVLPFLGWLLVWLCAVALVAGLTLLLVG
jgi:hypothetical protein